MPVGDNNEYMTVQELIDKLKKRDPNEPALYDQLHEKMCFFYHEVTRESDADPETCELKKDMTYIDEEFDCDICDETLCQITQDAKKLMEKARDLF